jgi:putative MATE family efflux protein
VKLTPVDREIWRLAVPAFLALIAEPLYLLADAAIVGHLGTPELAGLGVAGVVLQTIVGLCVFLAYGTTAGVARHLGAGDLRSALAQGVDGVWLAVLIGAVTTVAGIMLTPQLVGTFGVGEEVTGHAETYLRIALLGVTPLLVMLATTGVLRGLQDTRTPLVVAVAGNVLNVVLNLLLVFGLGPVPALGLAGSALGSVLAQVASAAALLAVVVRAARAHGASLTPDRAGIISAARAGVALVVRTLALRAALLVSTYAVTLAGTDDDVQLAAHQVAFTIWTFLAFALDAIAIAAQALTGRALGAGDVSGARVLTRRMVQWGIASGVVTGIGLAALSPVLGALFTPDDAVQALLVPVLLVAAAGQPVAGVVFVLDGVLIGAGDGAYLAWAGVAVLLAYAPVALLVAGWGLAAVWIAFVVVFMGGRGVVLLHRARGDRWLVTGAVR